jgi:hypothetical protein
MRHGAHRAIEDVGGKRPEDDGKGQHGEEKAVGFMHPLRIIAKRQLGRLTDHEIIALPYGLIPVGAFDLVADRLEELIESDDEEQKEGDIGHTAHDGDIALAEPAERRKA